jgi:hypothetical protein
MKVASTTPRSFFKVKLLTNNQLNKQVKIENLFEHQIGWCVGHEDGSIVVDIEDVKVQCFHNAGQYQKTGIFVDGLVIQG